MRLLCLLSALFFLTNQQSIASDTDDPDGGQKLQRVASEGDSLLRQDDYGRQRVVITNVPQRGWTYRQKLIAWRIAKIIPPLALATVGTTVGLTTEHQIIPPFLTRDWGDTFPYNEFFFPTAYLGVQKLGSLVDLDNCNSFICYFGLNGPLKYVISFVVPGAMILNEIVRSCQGCPSTIDEDTVAKVKKRYITKGLLMAAVGGFGVTWLWWSNNMWDQVFTYYGPQVLQQYNLTGAIDFFLKENRYMGINEIWVSAPCTVDSLKFYLIPSANGLPWSYSQPLLYILSMTQKFELSIPLIVMFLNLIYMIAWV